MADDFKGITQIIAMVPRGGKFAKSVVNFVHKAPANWEKFKSALQQMEGILKQGKLRLDGKQKTIFESNKNILKNHETVTKKKVQVPPVKKEDAFKGFTPSLVERSKARAIYTEMVPPASKYTKEMEKIDEELDALAFGGDKYRTWSEGEKAKLFKKLQANMKKLIDGIKKDDLTTLSLSQLNKKSQNLQKRIREISENPNIKGTVTEGPKADIIKALYDSEHSALTNARKVITKRNSELKYGKKYPVLDPENNAFVIVGLDTSGNPMKMSRFVGKFSASPDKTTGKWDRSGTSFYDKWNAETNQFRKEGKEVFNHTIDKEGKEIMSNPNYKTPKVKNMEIWNEVYSEKTISDLAKKGHSLKDIDMLMKGKEAKKYLAAQEAAETNLDTGIKMHERTATTSVSEIMEDLYHRGDDVYKMSIKEWIKKIPEHFAGGGRASYGEGTGGVSNFFKNKFKKFTREGIDEKQENWLKEQGLDMTLEEWQAKKLLEKLMIMGKLNLTMLPGIDDLEKGTDYATGGVANLFRKR